MGPSAQWYWEENAKPWEAVAHRLESLAAISNDERELIFGLAIHEKTYAKSENIFNEGEVQDCVYVCIQGWGARYRMLPDGQRQVVDFILPGSLFGATNDSFGMHVNSAEALQVMRVAVLYADTMRQLSRQAPRLAWALSLCMGEECARLSERVVSLGRRDAFERLGYFFLEIYYRLAGSNGARKDRIRVPVPQQEIADFLGLTSVHVSRTMRKMTEMGMIEYDDEYVDIVDEDALARASNFDVIRMSASPIPEPIRKSLLAKT